jgi:hypothetical protein
LGRDQNQHGDVDSHSRADSLQHRKWGRIERSAERRKDKVRGNPANDHDSHYNEKAWTGHPAGCAFDPSLRAACLLLMSGMDISDCIDRLLNVMGDVPVGFCHEGFSRALGWT